MAPEDAEDYNITYPGANVSEAYRAITKHLDVIRDNQAHTTAYADTYADKFTRMYTISAIVWAFAIIWIVWMLSGSTR